VSGLGSLWLVTVLKVIQRSTDFLAKRGVDSPRLQVELLLAAVLGLPRLQLYLNFERPVGEPELSRLREMVRRRGQREPLQHILGTAHFCGLELAVNRHVLVPRPETEQLADLALAFLKSRPSRSQAPPRVLDLGTGSGCLALWLARQCGDARVWAVDLSPEALGVARANAAAHGMTERIEFLEGDLFVAVPAGARFDLIVSNPPYIPSAEIDTLQPEVRDHDPRQALDGGADGLAFHRRIAAEAPGRLGQGGVLVVEFGDGQGGALRELFAGDHWKSGQVEKDLSGRERFFIATVAGA
jgi:release factor glutamine methyltransferase